LQVRPTVPCTGRSFDNAEVYADGKAEEVRNFVFVSVHLVDIFACTRFDVACGACRSWGRPSRCELLQVLAAPARPRMPSRAEPVRA